MKRARDFQRKRVYQWEWNSLCCKSISRKQCVTLMTKICEDYYVVVPQLKYFPKSKHPFYRAEDNTIGLPKYAQYPSIVIHECAHAILSIYGKPDWAAHGGEFMRLYLELLQRYMFYFIEEPYPTEISFIEYIKDNKGNTIKRKDWYQIPNKLMLASYFVKTTSHHRVTVADDWWDSKTVVGHLGIDLFDKIDAPWYTNDPESEVADIAASRV